MITPGRHRWIKWARNVFEGDDSSNDYAPDRVDTAILLGDAFQKQKDPEHLPPSDIFERVGDFIRKLAGVMRKQEVAFGFRVACATMSIAVLAFVEQTQAFFTEQRIVWAQIILAISMDMTTGAGIYGFFLRIAGTSVAMVTSLLIWYISRGRGIPGAALPLLFVFSFVEMYLMVKTRFLVIALVSMVTQVSCISQPLACLTIFPRFSFWATNYKSTKSAWLSAQATARHFTQYTSLRRKLPSTCVMHTHAEVLGSAWQPSLLVAQ